MLRWTFLSRGAWVHSQRLSVFVCVHGVCVTVRGRLSAAPSLPWAILRCLNLCIICRLAFSPGSSMMSAASTKRGAPQCLHYNDSDKLTGSCNLAWPVQTATVGFPLLLGLLISAIQNVFTSCCSPLCQCVIHHQAGVFKSPAFLSSYRYPPVCFLMCLLWKCLSEKPKLSKWHINPEFIALFTGCHPVQHLVWYSAQRWLYYLEEISLRGETAMLKLSLSNWELLRLLHQRLNQDAT